MTPLPTHDETRKQEDSQQHIYNAPFSRNDDYGVCGFHPPRPFSLRQRIRILRRLTALILFFFLLACYVLLVTQVLDPYRRFIQDRKAKKESTIDSQQPYQSSFDLSGWVSWCMYIMGYEALQIKYHTSGNNNGKRTATTPTVSIPIPTIPSPVIVCNHVSYLDAAILYWAFGRVGFVAKESIENAPLIGALSRGIGCLFVKHGDTKPSSSSSSSANEITNRLLQGHQQQQQQTILRQKSHSATTGAAYQHPPLVIFPEGTTTNGNWLLPFRKGAFLAGVPVQPVLLTYHWSSFNPSWESIGPFRHLMFLLAQPSHKCTMTVLKPMTPSSSLKQEEEGGHNTVQAFANDVRQAIAKAGNLKLSDRTYKDKREYHAYLRDQGYS